MRRLRATTPDQSQRAKLRVHSELAEALTPLIIEHGRERVAFALQGAMARWVKEDAEERKAQGRQK